jgi:serine/threonine protein kinase
MATTYSVDESVNEKGEKRTSQRRRSSDREATPDTANTSSNTTSNNNNNRDNDDDDDNNDTANISSDDDNNNNNNNNSNTGTMPARGNVLESAASLKWSTGEILPGGEHANSRSADQAFDATGSFFPVGSEQAQQQRSSSTASAGDLRRAASESGGGPASWIIDAHEIQFNKEIGRGSFGAVYTAKLRGSDVAVKKLYSSTSDADILADFSQEVSIMTKLRHPHVLLFLGQFEHKREVFFFFFFFSFLLTVPSGACLEPGALFIVFEYMPRGSVYDILHDPVIGPRLTFAAKMDIARQTAQGMNWLHLSKPPFLHRDLKTGNLLVDSNWTVKVCDFGLSQVKNVSKQQATLAEDAQSATEPGRHHLIGTPLWMSPEILSGASSEPDESADVYAYGIVLWEIITRQEPYPEVQSFDELVELVVVRGERPRFPPETPASLTELAGRCWHASRSERPTFVDILASLDDIIIDGVLMDSRACRFWKRRLYQQDCVPWTRFREELAAELKISPDGIAWRCLLALLVVSGGGAEAVSREKHSSGSGTALRRSTSASNLSVGGNAAGVTVAIASDKDDDLFVQMADFGRLLQYIGPLDKNFLETVEALLRKRWFWGDVPTAIAESLVQKAGRGAFLVRFSTSDVGGFSITVQSKSGRTKHFRISHKDNVYMLGQQSRRTLFELIDNFGAELYMLQPVPDSPFQQIFQKQIDTNAMSAYFDADLSFNDQNNAYAQTEK